MFKANIKTICEELLARGLKIQDIAVLGGGSPLEALSYLNGSSPRCSIPFAKNLHDHVTIDGLKIVVDQFDTDNIDEVFGWWFNQEICHKTARQKGCNIDGINSVYHA